MGIASQCSSLSKSSAMVNAPMADLAAMPGDVVTVTVTQDVAVTVTA